MRRSGRHRTRGQALVEFALVIPVFLFAMIALFDLGRAVFAYNSLTNAAREGARLAIVNQDVKLIAARAKAQTAIVELDDPSVSVGFYQVAEDGQPNLSDPCAPAAVGCLAKVRFEATYHPITPLVAAVAFGDGVTFTATSVLTVEYSCPNKTLAASQCPKQP